MAVGANLPSLIPEDCLERRNIDRVFGNVHNEVDEVLDGEKALTSRSLRGRSVADKAPGGIGPTQTCAGSSLMNRPCVAVTAFSQLMLSGDTVTMAKVCQLFPRFFFSAVLLQ